MLDDTRNFEMYYNITPMSEILSRTIKDPELVDKIYAQIEKHSFKNTTNPAIKEISLEGVEFILSGLKVNPLKAQTILKDIDPSRDLDAELLAEEELMFNN